MSQKKSDPDSVAVKGNLVSSAGQKTLAEAKKNKRDEFYTQMTDIEKELRHYEKHLKGKVIFCNCDDPADSNFFKYFALNFEALGLKKLITTHFDDEKSTYKLEITRGVDVNENGFYDIEDAIKAPLKGNGDFRNTESIELLKEVDIVVTNPPFSLFREYLGQLIKHKKKFIIMGNMNAITYKEVFPLLKDNKLWWGASLSGNKGPWFQVPNHYEKPKSKDKFKSENGINYHRLDNVVWYTNLDFPRRHENLELWKKYDPKTFPKYDNYDAIEVGKVAEIPEDYDGVMGVPITFLGKHNPKQFKIIGSDFEVKNGTLSSIARKDWEGKLDRGYINGKRMYSRLLIQKHKGKANGN